MEIVLTLIVATATTLCILLATDALKAGIKIDINITQKYDNQVEPVNAPVEVPEQQLDVHTITKSIQEIMGVEYEDETLKGYYDTCKQHYAKAHRRIRLLDSADKGDLWKSLNVKFPPYQILPDTNFISYVKNNVLASVYTVAKSAEVQPTSDQDREITTQINVALSKIWDTCGVAYTQYQAGERAALTNLGITQVGWDEGSVKGSVKGQVVVKNIDPMKFMRDPYAIDLDHASYCMTYEVYSSAFYHSNANYAEEFKKYEVNNKDSQPMEVPSIDGRPTAQNDNYTLVIFWVRNGDGTVSEYHTVNCEHLLYKKDSIKPAMFPFAMLYCNLPTGNALGYSECSKVYANYVAYNLMDSMAITAEYKNQRPPKFVNAQSGMDIQTFTKHGDEADRTFIVNGRADQAVHYHQFPQATPAMQTIKQSLQYGIQTVSGVDGRYTGRDTGSITTTGGTEEMLGRVTLIDTPKIINYESYAKRLSELLVGNLLHFCPKRHYYYRKPNSLKWETITVDFPKIPEDTIFDYTINISSELPKNKQRLAAMANMLMEKQMQYKREGSSVQLITEEEWLAFQDLPNKEYMLERMGIQRLQDATEEVSQVLFEYAGLVENGMKPDDAIMATSQSLQNKRAGRPEQAPEMPLLD